MSNEEKIREICKCNKCTFPQCDCCETYSAVIKMAEWKDEQFKKLLKPLMICAQQGYVQSTDEITLKEMTNILLNSEDFVEYLEGGNK